MKSANHNIPFKKLGKQKIVKSRHIKNRNWEIKAKGFNIEKSGNTNKNS